MNGVYADHLCCQSGAELALRAREQPCVYLVAAGGSSSDTQTESSNGLHVDAPTEMKEAFVVACVVRLST